MGGVGYVRRGLIIATSLYVGLRVSGKRGGGNGGRGCYEGLRGRRGSGQNDDAYEKIGAAYDWQEDEHDVLHANCQCHADYENYGEGGRPN